MFIVNFEPFQPGPEGSSSMSTDLRHEVVWRRGRALHGLVSRPHEDVHSLAGEDTGIRSSRGGGKQKGICSA